GGPGGEVRPGCEEGDPRERALGAGPVLQGVRDRRAGPLRLRPRRRLLLQDSGRGRRDHRGARGKMGDLIVLHDPPESRHGLRPEDRSIQEMLRLGVFVADKPQGPSSHQVSAWVRDMLGLSKAGHSGTLDPRVTGVLPIALETATRAVDAMLEGDKEYVGVLHLHQDVEEARVRAMLERFTGEVWQTPAVRSAVKRELRTRWIYELEPLEFDGRLTLFRTRCESGTYIRTLCNDVGEALGVGGHMLDLRRTRTATFPEVEAHSLLALQDAHVEWKEDGGVAGLGRV